MSTNISKQKREDLIAKIKEFHTYIFQLRKAHQANDHVVMEAAYGFDVKTTTESCCVVGQMRMYQELT